MSFNTRTTTKGKTGGLPNTAPKKEVTSSTHKASMNELLEWLFFFKYIFRLAATFWVNIYHVLCVGYCASIFLPIPNYWLCHLWKQELQLKVCDNWQAVFHIPSLQNHFNWATLVGFWMWIAITHSRHSKVDLLLWFMSLFSCVTQVCSSFRAQTQDHKISFTIFW